MHGLNIGHPESKRGLYGINIFSCLYTNLNTVPATGVWSLEKHTHMHPVKYCVFGVQDLIKTAILILTKDN